MSYADFVAGLNFRWVQPQTRMPRGYNPTARLLARLGFHFEISNTRLPGLPAGQRARLRELCLLPKMSTFAIGALINQAVARMPAGQAFVNVGVWNGFTFLAGMAGHPQQRCVGVDNFSESGSPRRAFIKRFEQRRAGPHQFFDMDYRDYFRDLHQGPIGTYIYDGEHSYANQLQGLIVAEACLAPGAIILVDDTNSPAAHQATLDFMARSPGRYQLLLDRPTRHNCHPTLWNGLMVLQHSL